MLMTLTLMVIPLTACWMYPALIATCRSLSVEGIFHSLMHFMAIIWTPYKVEVQWDNGDRSMNRELRKR